MTWYVESMHDVMYSLVAPSAVGDRRAAGRRLRWSSGSGLAVFDRGSEDIGELL